MLDPYSPYEALHLACIVTFNYIMHYLYNIFAEFICYDDGCHLRKYSMHDSCKDLTPVTKKLAEVETVVDKLHMQGHTEGWCRRTCDPYSFPELKNVSI